MQEIVIDTIGHYRAQRLLARGGMAKVYLAQDIHTGKLVAMKLVHSSAVEYSERFCFETKILTKLSHKHILPVIDYGECKSWRYLITPYISRGTLNQRLKKGPLSCEHAAELLDQLAQALQFAHEQGLVHRDIKASNILMKDDHFIYLADFGLAKHVDETADFSNSDYILGTPEYMAPELAEEKATPLSDLYSLGILLYQMVTGNLPFDGNSAIDICIKHLREFPPLPSLFNANLSEAVEDVILRALEKDPQRRFQTVQEFSQAYRQALEENRHTQMMAVTQTIPVLKAPQVSVYKFRQSPRRSKLASTMLGLAVAASIPVIFGLSTLSHRPSPLPAHAQLSSLPPHVNIVISTSPTPTSALVVPVVTTETSQSSVNLQNNPPQTTTGSSKPANANGAASGLRQIIESNIADQQRGDQSTNVNGDISDRINNVRQIIENNIPDQQHGAQSTNISGRINNAHQIIESNIPDWQRGHGRGNL